MIGKQGEIVMRNNQFWVLIEGELWHFQSNQKLVAGERVQVESLQGLTVTVRKI